MKNDYQTFLKSKAITTAAMGIEPVEPHSMLFPFQRDIVKWSLRRGRACVWADCGLGKTFIQIEWANQIPGDVLILAPLAVAQQTILEAAKLGRIVRYCRHQSEVQPGITIANYEMLEHFDASFFAGVVLDESSILKAFMGKTKRKIIDSFRNTTYKLACTATPAPNDHMELGNHCEFVGVMSSSEMLSAYFINDPAHVGHYRIKGHAEKKFWQWLASWAVMIKKPSDLGYSDEGFELPPLIRKWHIVDVLKPIDGYLFKLPAASLSERIEARRDSIHERTNKAAELCNSNDDQWLCWCALNAESAVLTKAIRGAVEVKGSDSIEHKTTSMLNFAAGKIRCLVSKSSICGFGMNFQSCHNQCHVGLSDSWEQYYQAVRRSWRFGQKHPVNCHVITSSNEGAVVENVMRKEQDFERMSTSLAHEMSQSSLSELRAIGGFKQAYHSQSITIPDYLTTQL